MTGQDPAPPKPSAEEDEQATERMQVDLEVAQGPRVGDYLLGGDANFSVDREAVDGINAALPGDADTGRVIVQASSAFRSRAVRYLAGEASVRQFLHVGTGMPRADSTHRVAQQVAPESRVVYCISDPVVMAHAHQLTSTPEGAVAYFEGNVADPEDILRQAAATLDLAQPVAVLLALTFVSDEEAPRRAAVELLGGVASGSYLVVANLALDINAAEFGPALQRLDEIAAKERLIPMKARCHAEVSLLFEGLELLEPGVVSVDHWHPGDESPKLPAGLATPVYGAVGRKP